MMMVWNTGTCFKKITLLNEVKGCGIGKSTMLIWIFMVCNFDRVSHSLLSLWVEKNFYNYNDKYIEFSKDLYIKSKSKNKFSISRI